MENCKVVKVDGEVFVGKLDGNQLSLAMPVTGDLTTELTRSQIGAYLTKKNLSELVTVGLGTTSAVMTRGFNDDELVLIAQAKMLFDRAERQAVLKLVNKEFASLLGK